MTETFERLLREILDLSEDERLGLALHLLNSVEGDPDPEVEAAWDREIAKRIASLASGETVTIPGAEVFARLRKITSGRS